MKKWVHDMVNLPQTSQVRIIGASEERGYAAVCKVQIIKGQKPNYKVSNCTGVLVAKNLVLLAGHCVANCLKITNGKCGKSGTVQVHCTFTRQVGTKLQSETYSAARWLFNRNFSQKKIEEGTLVGRAIGSSKDYALLVLKENVKHIEPIPIMPFDTLMKLKRENKIVGFTAVGYGKYSYDEAKDRGESGKKRSHTFRRFDVFPTTRVFKVYPSEETSKELPGERIATAHGDSGGPYFVTVDGVTYLVGLISSTTLEPFKVNGVNVTKYTTALSTDYPYAFFYSKYFKPITQSIGKYGYGYVTPAIPNRFPLLEDTDVMTFLKINENRKNEEIVTLESKMPKALAGADVFGVSVGLGMAFCFFVGVKSLDFGGNK